MFEDGFGLEYRSGGVRASFCDRKKIQFHKNKKSHGNKSRKGLIGKKRQRE